LIIGALIRLSLIKGKWQIPNMSEMLQRIGNLRPKFFGIADLTSGFFQMPITDESMQSTAFITFRGIYEWTRVPKGLLPSANYFQKMMAEYVLHGLIYIICEVYIDDLLIYGRNEEEFLRNVETVFERLREYNVTLNPKKVHLGLQTISFVGHEIDSEGINMSQKRVESTIDVIRPTNLKELYSFIGLVNFFHDHIPHHATVAKPLTQMVSVANQSKTKSILWTDAGVHAFQVLKNLVNVCPKLYYIDYQSDIVLCTNASDYAIGAYLYQKAKNKPDAIEQPIRFLSKTLTPVQSI